MKSFIVWTILLISSKIADAFVGPIGLLTCKKSFSGLETVNANDCTSPFLGENPTKERKENGLKSIVSDFLVTGTILASIAGAPQAATANVELSSGAFTIRTEQNGQSLMRTEIDAKDLLSSLFKNRKELTSSLKRVSDIVKEELNQPAWLELEREILQIEGDVTPNIKFKAPSDWQQTVKDISKGKLNVILNGEIINLSIDDSFSAAEDEIVIRAKGVKGVSISSMEESPKMIVKSNLENQIDAVKIFWNSPLPFGEELTQKIENDYDIKITTGNFLLGGIAAFVGGSYAASYSYYVTQIENAKREAEEKRKVIEEKKKRAAKKAATESE